MSGENNCYDIYIGNLSVTTSREKLKFLFSKIGEISSIWINQKHQTFTFAFITFCHLTDAKKADEQFNNKDLDGTVIKVSLSFKTELKLANCVRKKDDNILLPKREGILLQLPKRETKKIPTKEDKIRQILTDNLVKTNSKKFVGDFINAVIETDDLICSNKCHIIKTEPQTPNLENLDNTIRRFFNKSSSSSSSSKANSLFKVDFDLSKNNVITTKQYDKFFVLNINSTTTTTTITTITTTTTAVPQVKVCFIFLFW